MKATLKNMESLLLKQSESIDQLTTEFKISKVFAQSSRPKTAIPAPPPPPPPLVLVQPKSIEKDEKHQGHDAMLVELRTVLRYSELYKLHIC